MKLIRNGFLFILLMLHFIFAETKSLVENNAIIVGTVTNSETNKPIQYASVTLIDKQSNKIISGQLTDIDGYFILSNSEKGNYLIEVQFIGFTPSIGNDFTFDPSLSTIFDLGTISIQPKELKISAVEVNAERPLYKATVDKKIYVIDQMKTTSGGTCCDVMKKVPSLDLGPNGEVSLRGSENVAVLINGKRAGIIGDERKSCAVAVPVPAAMIDRVEIITSPSAEYDPDGMTGIVNIILKEEKASGHNGELSINIGNTNKLNLGSILSYRNNKLNIFSKFSGEMIEQKSNGYYIENISDSLNSQHFKDNELYFMNFGAKYDISDRMLFTSEAKFTKHYQNDLNTTHYYGNLSGPYQVDSQNDGFAQVYELGFYKNFLNDSKLALEFSYDEQEKDLHEINVDLQSDLSRYQLDLRKIIFKADYYHNLSDNIKYETGYKGRFNTHDKNYNENNDNFQYDENIHALYCSGTFTLTEKLRSKVGVRLEQVSANTIINVAGAPTKTPNNYDQVYHSAHLAYIFNPYSNLKFAYSGRVNRPELKILDPFPQNQFVSLVDTVGNPNLKPEFIDAFEISYSLTKNKYKTDLSLYHHHIKDIIQGYYDINNNHVTYNNSGQGSLNGVDIMLKISPLTFWDFIFTSNYYSSKITGGTDDNLNGNTSGGIIRGISMFKMPNGGDLELSSTQQLSKKNTAGTVEGKFNLDMAYQISLYDDRLKLTCKAINILDNDIYDQNIEIIDNNVVTNIQSYKKYNNRTFYITIQYKFGNISK